MKNSVAFFERGSWHCRTKTLLEDGTIKYGKKGKFNTEKEAEEYYYEEAEQFKKQQRQYQISHKKDKNILFTDYLIYWFEDVFSRRIETTTRMVNAYVLYSLLLPNVKENIKLCYVSAEYLDTLLKLVSKHCSSAGNSGRAFLYLAFKDAIIEGLVHVNPVKETKQYRRNQTKITILNKQQLRVFLKATSESNWYLEVLLGLFCGLRKGEILALKFADFNMENRTVSISRQLVANPVINNENKIESNLLIERPPKTTNSHRTLRVPEVVFLELQKRKLQIQLNKSYLKEQYANHDYISCQKDGKPHGLASMNIAIGKICNRNGLPQISVHSLRHMFATILLELQIPIAKISGLLGHSSVNTTFEYYCDVMEAKEKVIAFMNNAFTPEREA